MCLTRSRGAKQVRVKGTTELVDAEDARWKPLIRLVEPGHVVVVVVDVIQEESIQNTSIHLLGANADRGLVPLWIRNGDQVREVPAVEDRLHSLSDLIQIRGFFPITPVENDLLHL